MTTDIFDFMDEIAGQGRQAYLVRLEPQVDVRIARVDGLDAFTLDIELTPNVDDDEDIYNVATIMSRSEVEEMAKQAIALVEAFPVRWIEGP